MTVGPLPPVAASPPGSSVSGPATTLATGAGTAAFAAAHRDLPRNFRSLFASESGGDSGLSVSSVGLGTYLGKETAEDDTAYREAALLCLRSGVNLLDTAINYRAQRSERALGDALLDLGRVGLTRDQVVVCTKAGFLPFDGTVPSDPQGYLDRTYVRSGLIPGGEAAFGYHSMAPAYLEDQLQRSLRNLRLSAVDIFYLHNPETQLGEVPRPEFERRIRAAFTRCEDFCARGLIGCYGCATWGGFRLPPDNPAHLSLSRLDQIAREVAGPGHHFKVIQAPFNFAMTELSALRNQTLEPGGPPLSTLQAARLLGIAVICSGPLLQGKILAKPLPERLRAPLPGLRKDGQRALQFARSAPGATAALCGMKSRAHVEENLQVLHVSPVAEADFQRNFSE